MLLSGFLYVLLFIISSIVYNRIKNRRFISMVNQFPGPPALPIVGNTMRSLKRSPEDVMTFFQMSREKFGKILRIWVFNRPIFVVFDPKVLEAITTCTQTNLGKNDIYNFMIPWLGNGLLLSNGAKWHSRRKILTPAFHFNILEQFCEVFDKESSILLDKLKAHQDQKAFNIKDYVSLMTLDIVCQTAMGISIHVQTDAESKYVWAVNEITTIIASRIANTWQKSDVLFKIFARDLYDRQCKAIEVVHNLAEKIIKTRRDELIQQNEDLDLNREIEKPTKRMALLDILLKSSIDGEPLTNEAIREEVDTFMFGGHDTTTSGICFTLFLLARNKHVQDKLFSEIRDKLGDDKNRPITYRISEWDGPCMKPPFNGVHWVGCEDPQEKYGELQELKYIELVIKEAMRLFPPVPLIGRKIDEEITLEDGRKIPVGSNVTVNFFIMFRDEEVFSNAEKFIPERFELDNNKTNSFNFTPFSAGKRNCIGQKYGMLEMKSTITKVLRNFEVLPEGPDLIPLIQIVLRSKNGVHVGLKPRQYS